MKQTVRFIYVMEYLYQAFYQSYNQSIRFLWEWKRHVYQNPLIVHFNTKSNLAFYLRAFWFHSKWIKLFRSLDKVHIDTLNSIVAMNGNICVCHKPSKFEWIAGNSQKKGTKNNKPKIILCFNWLNNTIVLFCILPTSLTLFAGFRICDDMQYMWWDNKLVHFRFRDFDWSFYELIIAVGICETKLIW